MKSIFKISLAANPSHSLNYTVEIVGFIASNILEIKKRKKISERSRKELIGSDFEEFIDSDRYKTIVKRIPHILVFKMVFYYPWKVSVNHTDILHIEFCDQKFHANLIPYTNSEGCIELLQNVPL